MDVTIEPSSGYVWCKLPPPKYSRANMYTSQNRILTADNKLGLYKTVLKCGPVRSHSWQTVIGHDQYTTNYDFEFSVSFLIFCVVFADLSQESLWIFIIWFIWFYPSPSLNLQLDHPDLLGLYKLLDLLLLTFFATLVLDSLWVWNSREIRLREHFFNQLSNFCFIFLDRQDL